MKFDLKKYLKNPLVILAFILIVAFVLRWLEINKTSFWYDESFTGNTVQLPWKEMFVVIARDKVHPPLFYVITKVWGFAFGYSQDALRGLSILWGMLAVVASYFLGKEFFDEKKRFPKAGLVTAFVLAISPYFVAYSIEARSYAFLTLIAICLAYTVLKYLKAADKSSEKKKYLILSIILGVTICATHYLQIIYVVGLFCAVFVYNNIYTEKGLNTKLFYRYLVLAILALVALSLIPVQAILESRGISGSWWVPVTRVDDIARVYYSYLLGVVRYANGVPPQRLLSISLSPQVLAGALLVLHFVGFGYVVNDKKLSMDIKRSATFLFTLSLITFIGFMSLSLINFNTFVERYTIAPGVILVISMTTILVLCLRSSWVKIVSVLIVYIAFIFLLRPMPALIDYRVIGKGLTEENNILNTQRDVFQSPADMINTMYYTGRSKAYYLFNFADEYEGWALVNTDRGVYLNDIKPTDLFIVTLDQEKNFVGNGFKEVKVLDNNLVILQRI